MKIVHETIDNQPFIDILLSPKEFEMIREHQMLSKEIEIFGAICNMGITVCLPNEDDE